MCVRDARAAEARTVATKASSGTELQAELALLRRRVAELKATEAEHAAALTSLGQAEMKLRTLLEQLPAVVYMDEAGRPDVCAFVSPQIEALLGFTAEEWRGDNSLWVKQLHPQDRERVLAIVDRWHQSAEPFSVEYRYLARDGRVVWVHDKGTVSRDADGKPLLFVGVLTDISERKQAESEVRSLARFPDEDPGPVLRLARDGAVMYANEPAQSLLAAYASGVQQAAPAAWRDLLAQVIASGTAREMGIERAGRTYSLLFRPVADAGYVNVYGSDISDRQRAEDALRQSEARYRAVVEDQIEMVMRYRPEDDVVTFANDAYCRFAGVEREELIGRPYYASIPPEDLERSRAPYSSYTPQDLISTNEHRVIMPSGEVRWQQWTDRAFFGKDGSLTEIQAVGRDITEHKRAEEALRESEERFRSIFEASPIGIEIFDRHGLFVAANQADVEMYGMPSASSLKGFSLLQSANLPPGVCEKLLAKQPVRYETICNFDRIRNHHLFETAKVGLDYHDVQITPIVIDNRLRGYLVQIQDISERRRAQEALQDSERRYRLLFEAAPAGIGISDLAGNVLAMNRAMERITGYTLEELKGVGVASRYVVQGERQKLLEILAESGSVREHEVQLRRKDGTIYHALLNIDRIDIEGQAAVLTHQRDITEHKRLEEQFLQAQKMESVGRLAGGVAHDFNNLLTAISGNASFVLDSLQSRDPSYEDIQQVLIAANRASDLTRQLLAFSRRQIIALKVVDLNDLILDLDRMLRRLIGEDIELVAIPDAGLGRVKVDPGQIEQILVNLAVNARDAMPDGGRLLIETSNVTLDENYVRERVGVVAGEYVKLIVSDNGAGMSQEVKDHLFEPFFTTKGAGQGTGLGLATVYGIVKQHGGHISVESELGRGTRVTILLPRVVEKAQMLPVRDGEGYLPTGAETVLVVEDEPSVRYIAARILRRQGYTVLEAANGHAALALAQDLQTPIHLLLTDVVLPRMSGRELAARLKDTRPNVAILFASGYTDDSVLRRGVLAEGMAFLPKPFTAAALTRKVRAVLDERYSGAGSGK